MGKGVAVTGMGIISSIGNNIEENYKSLLSRKSGISSPEILNTRLSHLPVGEIKFSNEELALQQEIGEKHSFTRSALLGLFAAQEALSKSGILQKDLKNTGFINGNSVGGIDATEEYFSEYSKGNPLNRFIRAQHPGFTTNKIAEALKIGGYVTTLSTACSSSANAIMLGARLIKAGKIKRVIVGGTDGLTKFTLNGFNSLRILSSEECRPFDDNRTGLNLGEGAAYLILESDDVLGTKEVLGRISGYGNANDAFHQTASSETGEGAFLAIQKALNVADILPEDISYINAHGTATRNNDLSESIAIQRIFGNNLPDFSSTKAYTGHSLAPAGSMEAVFSFLGLQKNKIFPTLNFEKPMQETNLRPVTELKEKKLEHILSNSFGFGGNCTSLIFSKDEN